jgi:hypothetical protein
MGSSREWYRTYQVPGRRTRGHGGLGGVVIVTLSVDSYFDYGVQARRFEETTCCSTCMYICCCRLS